MTKPGRFWRERKERRRSVAELLELGKGGQDDAAFARAMLRGIVADTSTTDSNRIGAARALAKMQAADEKRAADAELQATIDAIVGKGG